LQFSPLQEKRKRKKEIGERERESNRGWMERERERESNRGWMGVKEKLVERYEKVYTIKKSYQGMEGFSLLCIEKACSAKRGIKLVI